MHKLAKRIAVSIRALVRRPGSFARVTSQMVVAVLATGMALFTGQLPGMNAGPEPAAMACARGIEANLNQRART